MTHNLTEQAVEQELREYRTRQAMKQPAHPGYTVQDYMTEMTEMAELRQERIVAWGIALLVLAGVLLAVGLWVL